MIKVTESAKKELAKLLSEKVDWPEACLRLLDRGGGVFGIGMDIEMPGDFTIEHDGRKVLVVAAELAPAVRNIIIDVDDTPRGKELVIDGIF